MGIGIFLEKIGVKDQICAVNGIDGTLRGQDDAELADGYYLAAMTDQYLVGIWPPKDTAIDGEKLLELRIFNQEMEYKLVRGDISRKFFLRIIDERPGRPNCEQRDFFEEWQYLDIDTSKGRRRGDGKTAAKGGDHSEEEGTVTTTGGGSFYFPFEKDVQPGHNARVCIRYYLGKYEETGQARVEDWRVVGFRNE